MSTGAGGPLGFPPDPDAPADSPPGSPPAGREPGASPRAPAPPPRPPGGGRYAWIAGIVGVVLVALIGLNTVRTKGPGSRGIMAGQPLPAFAVPLALGPLQGDADFATRPGSGQAGRVPACQLRGPGILNICQQYEKGPVVLAFLATRGAGRCEDQLDVLQRLQGRFPGVRFAAVAIAGDRGELRTLVRRRGWTFPVGYDRDGAVANLYHEAICPQIVLASRGGVSRGTLLGYQPESRLVAAIGQLAGAAG